MTEETYPYTQDASVPALPEPRSSQDMEAEELSQYWLDPTQDYPDPYYLLEYNGSRFSPLGGIQAISGQKKNGKTFVLAQLMAAALGTGTERVSEYLPGLRTVESTVAHLGHAPRVLYCDTEMEKLNTAKVLRRVHWLCGWDMKANNDRFHILWLREVPKTDTDSANHERWRIIKTAIRHVKPDIVFIDGLRDLVNDFNDNPEASAIVSEMMSIASHEQICIWNVLHYNPRPSNDDDSKMRGHLGTELGNKVSDTLVSFKHKDKGSGRVTFTVTQQDARSKDIDDWTFEIDDSVGGLGIPRIINSGALPADTQPGKATGDPIEDVERWFNEKKDSIRWPATRQTIKQVVFAETGYQTNKARQDLDLKMLLNKRILVESNQKTNGHVLLILNPDTELKPREEELPF